MKKSEAPPDPKSKEQASPSDPALDDLEFPVAPGFKSMPPRIAVQAMLERIEQTKPWLDPEYEKRRRQRHGEHVEFVL